MGERGENKQHWGGKEKGGEIEGKTRATGRTVKLIYRKKKRYVAMGPRSAEKAHVVEISWSVARQTGGLGGGPKRVNRGEACHCGAA